MARKSWKAEIEPWFLRNGLPYFVEEERTRARAGLRPRKIVPLVVAVVLLCAVLLTGAGVAGVFPELQALVRFAPATLTMLLLAAALLYFVTVLRARPIVTWAVRRTFTSLGDLVPMVTRALPLLLLFITFLFINAEVWEVSARLDGAVMWLTILLFSALAVTFLLVRLPEEVDRVDDFIDARLLLRATRGTPIAAPTQTLVDEVGDDLQPEQYGDVPGLERKNLILVLLITQIIQVLLLSFSVFVFFMAFGGLIMDPAVQQNWTGQEQMTSLPGLSHLSVELFQVSVFLAAFSGLYFTVGVLTDENYRDHFFALVLKELERAVGVRAAYLALTERGTPGTVAGRPARATAPDQPPADAPDPAPEAAPDPVPGAVQDAQPPDLAAAGDVPAADDVLAHWSFAQERTDEIGFGSVTGEVLLCRDGRLLRRNGGPSHRDGRTRWDFDAWHPFAGWRAEPDPDRARLLLVRRGYLLAEPGPVPLSDREAGPFDGPPDPDPWPVATDRT